MNQYIKEKWITALESGEYKQAQGRLRTAEGFCCLGVLCDIALKDGVPGVDGWELDNTSYSNETFYNLPSGQFLANAILPPIVRTWAGFDLNETTGPIITDEDGTQTTVAGLNDDGSTFIEISAWIKEHC